MHDIVIMGILRGKEVCSRYIDLGRAPHGNGGSRYHNKLPPLKCGVM